MILTKCHGAVGEVPQVRGFFFPKEIRASKDYVNQGGRLPFLSCVYCGGVSDRGW